MGIPWTRIYREANHRIDALAKLGTNLNSPNVVENFGQNYAFVTFDHPLDVVENLLTLDKATATNVCNRLISISVWSNFDVEYTTQALSPKITMQDQRGCQ